MMDISCFRLSLYNGYIFIDYCSNDAAVQSFGDGVIIYFNYKGTYIVDCVNIRVDDID